jgi:hypothetical protein
MRGDRDRLQCSRRWSPRLHPFYASRSRGQLYEAPRTVSFLTTRGKNETKLTRWGERASPLLRKRVA